MQCSSIYADDIGKRKFSLSLSLSPSHEVLIHSKICFQMYSTMECLVLPLRRKRWNLTWNNRLTTLRVRNTVRSSYAVIIITAIWSSRSMTSVVPLCVKRTVKKRKPEKAGGRKLDMREGERERESATTMCLSKATKKKKKKGKVSRHVWERRRIRKRWRRKKKKKWEDLIAIAVTSYNTVAGAVFGRTLAVLLPDG